MRHGQRCSPCSYGPLSKGLGIGRQLLKRAEQALFIQRDRISPVTDGSEEIRANGFYRRLGWERVGRVDERDVKYEKQRPRSVGPAQL
ncbi:GNAT family N-acetyltransferase [Pseudomonas capeferrum]|uniref:GNAT family N-acetyltransferase n=1 Tax=Pseudomonas capeferrum TaxID=1495066 RepID=UPI00280A70A6|nr:GNAT family N-acetyltransferase [Pseudomonas capeferrum]